MPPEKQELRQEIKGIISQQGGGASAWDVIESLKEKGWSVHSTQSALRSLLETGEVELDEDFRLIIQSPQENTAA